ALDPGAFIILNAGAVFGPEGQWAVLTGGGYPSPSVVLVGAPPGFAAHGNQFLNLHGTSAGAIRTSNFLPLRTGVTYRLRFAMSSLNVADPNTPNEPRIINVRIQRGGLRIVDRVFVFDPAQYPDHSPQRLVWVYHTIDFTVPDNDGFNILFRSNNVVGLSGVNLAQFSEPRANYTGPYGPLLDDVSLIELPTTVAIRGRVTLEEFLGDLTRVPVTVELRQGGVALRVVQVNLDAEGNYTIPDVEAGTYDLAFKASHWLRKVVAGVVVTGAADVTGVDVSLVNGDVNGDNEVSLLDFGAFVAAFGSSPGNTEWNPDADLNGDEEVNLLDFGVLVRSFGEVGDE
ncbi:MAG: dockerin type I domain-containing protein, partial [Armatimonadota bacterium]|nr:dockerin type I domain-containing protein [Armatimonadota bacterium]